jgi:GNAT superfamily N-acetyltransferase
MPRHPSHAQDDVLVDQLDALAEDIAAARALSLRAARWEPPPDRHRHPPPVPHGEDVELADGAHVLVRPVEPGDRIELSRGLRRLSALSRYRQFGERAPSAHELERLAEADHHDQELLTAVDPTTGDGIGVAAYARERADPQQASFHCVVVDAWQHRGVGRLLSERLAARAGAAGICRFTAHVVRDDEAGRRLLADILEDLTEQRDGGLLNVSGSIGRSPSAGSAFPGGVR